MLSTQTNAIKKRDVVKHFAERYDKSAVYRELKKLKDSGQVSESDGNVSIATIEGAVGAN